MWLLIQVNFLIVLKKRETDRNGLFAWLNACFALSLFKKIDAGSDCTRQRNASPGGISDLRCAARQAASALAGKRLSNFLQISVDQVERSFYLYRMNKTPGTTREKILTTAEQLIYQNGIHATGMDLLVKTSGVARKSIYRYFATKDDVAAAALNARDERWIHWFRTESDKGDTPQARILNMFSALKSWFESDGFRGCAFINTAGEVGDPDDPVRQIAKRHKQKLLDYTLELTTQLNIEQPAALARQLLILMEGAITLAYVMGDNSAADSAREVAKLLLEQAAA